MNEKPVFSQRGGVWLRGWVGGWAGGFLSWPFARLNVFSDALEIIHARYPREKILSLRQRRGVLCNGLEIAHNKYDVPQSIVFWSFNFGALLRALYENGYDVET
jgi:hypothetical protein